MGARPGNDNNGRDGSPPFLNLRRHRRGLAATVVGGLLAGGVACGNSDSPRSIPGSPPAATPAGPIPGFDDPRRWAGRTLRIGAFGDEVQAALHQAVWAPFADATGCRVEAVTTDYGRLQSAVEQQRAYADVLLVDPIWAESAPARGLIQPVDLSWLDPESIALFGGGETAAPAYAYALVSAFRRDAIVADAPPQSWAEWWDAKTFPGPRSLSRRPFGTFEFALLSTGLAPADLYPLNGQAAIERLKQISDKVVERWWDSGLQPVAWLGTDRINFASAWHHRVIAGQRDGYAIDFSWQQGLLVSDCWVVPVGAAAPDVAVDYIRYALTPEAQAAFARAMPMGPVVPAAFKLLEPRVAARLPTAPANLPGLIRADVAWWSDHQSEAVQIMNTWLLGG